MALAHRAGIQIFVTGGIGGVHRGAETSMDISADLYELSHTPLTVISAGVKSILDIGENIRISGNTWCLCCYIWRYKRISFFLYSS
ncbi:hypothetical protein JTE90_017397 [Oedothorax gibbosus]|uniref:Pseudouridine-5'-phosphate glycosidase n=1 Tax=Oedothorax gibbosus TaxID=931172 RepID=A0AAV6TQU0_9ARAC|nr:hypothetical protein JTE90_017397 [Oedothorax gibbosus]